MDYFHDRLMASCAPARARARAACVVGSWNERVHHSRAYWGRMMPQKILDNSGTWSAPGTSELRHHRGRSVTGAVNRVSARADAGKARLGCQRGG